MSAKVDRIARDFETAQQEYDQALAGLKRPDGRPVYAPDEETRRRQELTATYTAAQQEALGALQQLVTEADAQMTAATVSDPLMRLTSTQLAEANQLRGFISEDFQRQPAAMLAQQCRDALSSGDKVRIALYTRYARQALASRFADPREGMELKVAIGELEETFVDRSKHDDAQALKDAAGKVQRGLYTTRYLEQAYGPAGNRQRTA